MAAVLGLTSVSCGDKKRDGYEAEYPRAEEMVTAMKSAGEDSVAGEDAYDPSHS